MALSAAASKAFILIIDTRPAEYPFSDFHWGSIPIPPEMAELMDVGLIEWSTTQFSTASNPRYQLTEKGKKGWLLLRG